MFEEAVCPICSPQFAETHAEVLAAGVEAWAALPFLLLTKQNKGWATWRDWFARAGVADLAPQFTGFDNYVYLLEAAAAGKGLAIGWRGLVERHLANGTLVSLECRVWCGFRRSARSARGAQLERSSAG